MHHTTKTVHCCHSKNTLIQVKEVIKTLLLTEIRAHREEQEETL